MPHRRFVSRHRAGVLLAVALSVVLVALTGCQSAVNQQRQAGNSSATPGQAFPRGGELRVGLLRDLAPPTLLQIGSAAAATGQVVSNVFDTLIRYSRDSLTIEPALATAWELSDDGLSLALTLRDDVTYHDGRPFTSADVEGSLKAYLDGPWTPQFARTAAAISAFDTADPHRVVLTFEHPLSNIFDLLDSAPIVDVNTLDELLVGQTFNGTGAFRFASWQPNSSIRLERNTQYWGGSPPLEALEFNIISDSRALASRLRTGQIDVAIGLTNHDHELATSRYGYSEVSLSGAEGQQYVGLNVLNPTLSDLRVRQAIAYAIDRPRIVGDVLRGSGYVVNLPWPEWSPAYRSDLNETYTRDVERAKAILRNVGPLPPIDMDYPAIENYRVVAEIVQSNLRDIGIETRLVPNDTALHSEKLIGAKFTGLWINGHGFAQFTPSTLAVSAYPFNAAKNSSNFSDGRYAAAADAAWKTRDGNSAEALAAYRVLDEVWLKELFLIEIGVVFTQVTTSPTVNGIGWDRRGQLRFESTYLGRADA